MNMLGRWLQITGLVALPLAMLLNLMNSLNLWMMLSLAVAGFSAFWIGRILEGYSTRG